MMPLQSNGTNYTDKDNKMAAMKKAASSLKKQLKPLGADKAELRKAAAKKADPMKASARSHQGDLARVAGSTAAANKAAAMRKAKNTFGIMDQTGAAKSKAERRTLKSFK